MRHVTLLQDLPDAQKRFRLALEGLFLSNPEVLSSFLPVDPCTVELHRRILTLRSHDSYHTGFRLVFCSAPLP